MAADLREKQENQGFSENRIDKLEFNDPSEDGLHTCDAGYGLKLNDYPLLERYPSN